VYHGAAVGILEGKAGNWQYTTERVCDPDVVAIRRKIKATASTRMGVDQASLKAELNNGEVMEIFVETVRGSLQNPLSGKDLEEKFKDMSSHICPRQSKIRFAAWCGGWIKSRRSKKSSISVDATSNGESLLSSSNSYECFLLHSGGASLAC